MNQAERRSIDWHVTASIVFALAAASLHALPLVAITCSMVSSTFLGHVRLRRYIRSVWLRRLVPAVPYLCLLGLPLDPASTIVTSWPILLLWLPIVCLPAVCAHALRYKALVVMFNPVLLKAFDRGSLSDRWSESAFFFAPAILQELLFRGYLITALSSIGLSPVLSVLISAAAFVLDHLFTRNSHVRPTLANLMTWTFAGVIWGAAVVLGGTLWLAMFGHLLMNLPAAVQPHLRGRS